MGEAGGRVESISELPVDKRNCTYINSSKTHGSSAININNNRIEHFVVQKDSTLVSKYDFNKF